MSSDVLEDITIPELVGFIACDVRLLAIDANVGCVFQSELGDSSSCKYGAHNFSLVRW